MVYAEQLYKAVVPCSFPRNHKVLSGKKRLFKSHKGCCRNYKHINCRNRIKAVAKSKGCITYTDCSFKIPFSVCLVRQYVCSVKSYAVRKKVQIFLKGRHIGNRHVQKIFSDICGKHTDSMQLFWCVLVIKPFLQFFGYTLGEKAGKVNMTSEYICKGTHNVGRIAKRFVI